MATTRKRSRKSKLEVRKDEDIEDEILQPALIEKEKPVKKKALKVTKSPPYKINVTVDIEEVDDFCIQKEDPALPKTLEDALTKYQGRDLYPMLTNTYDDILETSRETVLISSNLADKIIDVGLRNIIGYYRHERLPFTVHEVLINEAIEEFLLDSREGPKALRTPLFYQCCLCSLAWWHLEPFREHIKIHDPDSFKVSYKLKFEEVFIVANKGPLEEKPYYIIAEGDCPKCGNDMDYHINGNSLYKCPNCGDRFSDCAVLETHVNLLCTFRAKRKSSMSNMYTICFICSFFVKATELNAHQIKMHTVRSDLPAVTKNKGCWNCNEQYISLVKGRVKSRLSTTCLKHKLKTNMEKKKSDKYLNCKVCSSTLSTHDEIEHMITHTSKYRIVYRCMVCVETRLFFDNASAGWHIRHHHKISDVRKLRFFWLPIPKACIKEDLSVLVSTASTSKDQTYTSYKKHTNKHEKQKQIKHTKEKNENEMVKEMGINDFETKIEIKQEKIDECDTVEEKVDPDSGYYENLLSKMMNFKPVNDVVVKTELLDTEIETNTETNVFNEQKCRISFENHEVYDINRKIKIENDVGTSENDLGILVNDMGICINDMGILVNDIEDETNEDGMGINKDTDISEMGREIKTENEDFNRDLAVEVKAEPIDIDEHTDFTYLFEEDAEIKTEIVDNENGNLPDTEENFPGSEESNDPNFTDESYYNESSNEYFNSKYLYECFKCGIEYNKFKLYYRHHVLKHSFKNRLCPICQCRYKTEGQLFAHLFRHIKNNYVNYVDNLTHVTIGCRRIRCRICYETIDRKHIFVHWDKHVHSDTRELQKISAPQIRTEPKTLANDKCLSPTMLKKTLSQLTATAREKFCVVCEREFNRYHDCKRHLVEHLLGDAFAKKAELRALQCQICKKGFQQAPVYKFHMREHGAMPVYKCVPCNKTFSDSSNFAKHKKIHSQELYTCDLCKAKFHTKKFLIAHLWMHRTTEPFKCESCDKIFYTKSVYNKHLYAKHEIRLTRYNCKLCDARFSSVKQKWDHAWEIHNERKASADCVLCNKMFRKVSDLKRHVKLEHNGMYKRNNGFSKVGPR